MPLRFRILLAEDARADTGRPAGPRVEREVELPDGLDELRVGRRADVELPLPFAALSAVHAWLRRGADGWTVEDARSVNGTWLDGERLTPGARRALDQGAELRLGNVRLRFEGEGPASAPAEGPVEHTATIARRLVSDLLAGATDGAPTLTVVRGAPARSLHLVALERPYVAGRAETCALPLGVEEVSREHAAFARDATGVVVRDLGSKNGVVVAGARVAGARRLVDGDVVEIGPVAVRLDDPVGRYLRELENAAAPSLELAPASTESPAPPPAEVALPPIRRLVGSSQVAVTVSIAVLLLLVAATLAVFW